MLIKQILKCDNCNSNENNNYYRNRKDRFFREIELYHYCGNTCIHVIFRKSTNSFNHYELAWKNSYSFSFPQDEIKLPIKIKSSKKHERYVNSILEDHFLFNLYQKIGVFK